MGPSLTSIIHRHFSAIAKVHQWIACPNSQSPELTDNERTVGTDGRFRTVITTRDNNPTPKTENDAENRMTHASSFVVDVQKHKASWGIHRHIKIPLTEQPYSLLGCRMFSAACIQLRCTTDVEANLQAAETLIRRAAAHGANLIATPENTAFLGPQFHKIEQAEAIDGPIAQKLGALAEELSIHLLVGSLAERRMTESGSIDQTKCHNTSLLFGPDGKTIATYRKMHLFDVEVPGGLSIRESDTIAPGDAVVVAETSLGKIGMSICYDLRFPELYRAMVDQGADIICIPSAFTLTTGKDHWHALLRARAIETQCWIMAPAQWGTHDQEGKRKSYGHSLIVDPWGTVVCDKGHGEGFCISEIDPTRTDAVRRAIPVRTHRRL